MALWTPPQRATFAEYLDICTFLNEVGTPPLLTVSLPWAVAALPNWALLHEKPPGDLVPVHAKAMTLSDILVEAFTLFRVEGEDDLVGFASVEQARYIRGMVARDRSHRPQPLQNWRRRRLLCPDPRPAPALRARAPRARSRRESRSPGRQRAVDSGDDLPRRAATASTDPGARTRRPTALALGRKARSTSHRVRWALPVVQTDSDQGQQASASA